MKLKTYAIAGIAAAIIAAIVVIGKHVVDQVKAKLSEPPEKTETK